MMVEIRQARPEDKDGIRCVHQQAFGGRSNEADLVEMLQAAGKAPLSLVATRDDQVVGHVLFSPVSLDPSGSRFHVLGLAPLAILLAHQKQGLGSALIQAGLTACREAGYDAVVVLGDPGYYSRFGFRKARDFGLGNEYGADDAFMVQELREGALAGKTGVVTYAPEFRAAGC